jgi:hypothetical protein
VPRCYKQDKLVDTFNGFECRQSMKRWLRELLWLSRCELLLLEAVAESGDSLGTKRKGKVCRWKLRPGNGYGRLWNNENTFYVQ